MLKFIWFITKESEEIYKNSLEITKSLQNQVWIDSCLTQMNKYNVTHVLIHKKQQYCKKNPFHKLYDSEDYLVYEVK